MTRGGLIVSIVAATLAVVPLLIYKVHQSLPIDNPQPSDVILVPAGDFISRSSQAIALAKEGFGPRIVIDEGTDRLTFGRTLAERREDQVSDFPVPVRVCPIRGESTSEESKEVRACLAASHPQRILLVTSDFHTRRALAIFQGEMPSIQFSVSAVPTDYSRQPWRAESVATAIREWIALVWWRIRG
jgi:uncharacterized SAM-binding protein YcdF (DUF218 family)